MARIFRRTGELPLTHSVGLSDKLFLAICDAVEEKLGGEKILRQITKKKAWKIIKDEERLCKESCYVYLTAKRIIFLSFMVMSIDECFGEIALNLYFPVWGDDFQRVKVMQKIAKEFGIEKFLRDGQLRMSVFLKGDDAPVLEKFDNSIERNAAGVHSYITHKESQNAL